MMALSEQSVSDALLVRYLLGELAPDEAEPLDQRSIADDHFLLRLAEVEHGLVDSYVLGKLSAENAARFKSFYLSSPLRVQRVAFAEAFLQRAELIQQKVASAEPRIAESAPASFWSRFSSPIAAWSLAG